MKLLKNHWLPIFILIALGTFSFLVDGILTFNFSPEKFLSEPIRSSNADITLLATFANKMVNPLLYLKDHLLNEFYGFYPKPFIIFIASAIKIFGDIESALIALSIFSNIVFWISLYSFFFYVSKNYVGSSVQSRSWELNSKFWSVVLTLASLYYTRPAFGTMWWGTLGPDGIIPRNLIFTFTPVILIFFIKLLEDKRIIYLFAFLGLLTNVHSLTSLHLTAWLGLSFILYSFTKDRVKILLICGLVWVAASVPYIYSYLTSTFDPTSVPKEVLEFRLKTYFLPTINDVSLRGRAFIAPVVFGIVGFILLKKSEVKNKRILSVFPVSLLLLISLGIILQANELFVEFQFLRLTIYIYLLAYLFSIFIFLKLSSGKSLKMKVLGTFLGFVLLPIIVFPKFEALARYSVEVPRVIFYKVFPRSDEAPNFATRISEDDLTFNKDDLEAVEQPNIIGTTLTPTAPKKEEEDKEEEITYELGSTLQESVSARSSWEFTWQVKFSGNWVEFGELLDYVKNNTGIDDIFMLPPNGGSIFRLFAERAVVITWKDGSASGFSGDYAQRWFDTYQDVRRAYHGANRDQIIETAKKYNANYILMYPDVDLPLDLEFSNFNFRLYSVN